MMRSRAARSTAVLAGIAGLLSAPTGAAGQTASSVSETVVRVTPFVGYSPAFHRFEQRRVVLQQQVIQGEFETRFGSGMAAGLLFEVRSAGPLRVTSGALVMRRNESITQPAGTDTTGTGPGLHQVVAKLALALRFNEGNPAEQINPLNASVFGGPAYVLELPSRDRVSGRRAGPVGFWAANAGVDAEFPLGGAVAAQFGLEDFAVLWGRRALERRVDAEFARASVAARTTVHADASHMWLLRAALTFRF